MDLNKLDKLIESVMNRAYLQGKYIDSTDESQENLKDSAQEAKKKLVDFITENSGNKAESNQKLVMTENHHYKTGIKKRRKFDAP